MKTQVIQLERHDDVTSVKDKIAWSKASRVLLVWPRRGRVFDRPLDLLLLQRACQAEGAQFACVADDDDILDHAKELGIPVFRSAKIAQRLPWRRQRQKKSFELKPFKAYAEIEAKRIAAKSGKSSWQNRSWVRLAAITSGIAAILCLVLFLAPEAKITIVLKQDQQQMLIPVYASPELLGLNQVGGLPVTYLNVIVEGHDTQPTTGTMKIPERAATGRVQFTNLTDQPITIPTGTVVQTSTTPIVQYQTLREGSLPARPGSTVDVNVQAQQAGSIGNFPVNSIHAVVGTLGAKLAVTNLVEISGGRDVESATGSKLDADLLRERLLAQLKKNAWVEMKSKNIQGSQLFEQTLEIAQVLDEKLSPSTGLPADQLDLTLRVEIRAWTVRQDDLIAICRTVLDANLTGDRMPFNSTIEIETVAPLEFSQNQINWKVLAKRQVREGWNETRMIQAVAGKRVEEGQKDIGQMMNLVTPAEITLSPTWWPIIPLLPGRIQVIVQ